MPPERFAPDDPREWINRAKSNLAHAKASFSVEQVYYEDVCFDCQQAVEKALKALLVQGRKPFPRTHDLSALMTLVREIGINIPDDMSEAADLTDYAVEARYPGPSDPITRSECQSAVFQAQEFVNWAEQALSARIIHPGKSR